MKNRIERSTLPVIKVLETGATATSNVSSGAFVPVVMVATDAHPSVAELIRAHAHISGGDCQSSWARPPLNKGLIYLTLQFERPSDFGFHLAFDLPGQAGAVDQVMRAKSLYLQHGSSGRGLEYHIDEPRILIEAPADNFSDIWDDMFLRAAAKIARREGASYLESRSKARELIDQWRNFFDGHSDATGAENPSPDE